VWIIITAIGLCWRDFHPQDCQLASLHGSLAAEQFSPSAGFAAQRNEVMCKIRHSVHYCLAYSSSGWALGSIMLLERDRKTACYSAIMGMG
jgi:hypothetical protein